MDSSLAFPITAQPTENSCGPTCLHSVYRFWGDDVDLGQVIDEVQSFHDGSTGDAFLGLHAIRRGFRATILSFNLSVFDPSWFSLDRDALCAKLEAQLRVKSHPKLEAATRAYLEFLQRGGDIEFRDLSGQMLRSYLKRGRPIITGLSATWLYQAPREMEDTRYDDLRGEPAGHFVVLHGYDSARREVCVADPYEKNPFTEGLQYRVQMSRLITAVMLGVVSYDCNLLVIEPAKSEGP